MERQAFEGMKEAKDLNLQTEILMYVLDEIESRPQRALDNLIKGMGFGGELAGYHFKKYYNDWEGEPEYKIFPDNSVVLIGSDSLFDKDYYFFMGKEEFYKHLVKSFKNSSKKNPTYYKPENLTIIEEFGKLLLRDEKLKEL